MWKLPKNRIPAGCRQLGPGEQITEYDLFWSLAGKFEQARPQDIGLIIQEKTGKLWIRELGMPPLDSCMAVIGKALGPVISEILLDGIDEEDANSSRFDHDLIWDIASACSKWNKRTKEDK